MLYPKLFFKWALTIALCGRTLHKLELKIASGGLVPHHLTLHIASDGGRIFVY